MTNYTKRVWKASQAMGYASTALVFFPSEQIVRGTARLVGHPVDSKSMYEIAAEKSLHKFRRATLGRERTEQVEEAQRQARFQ